MSALTCLFLTPGLLGAELLYLKLARQFRLFDVPNPRSLHQDDSTVRGGGVIVYLAVLGTVLAGDLNQPYFFLGLTVVALVSFADDLFSSFCSESAEHSGYCRRFVTAPDGSVS